MLATSTSFLALILAGLMTIGSVSTAPLAAVEPAGRSLHARSIPSAPRFFVYADQWVSGETGPPPVADVKGFNVFALSFLLTEGAFDKAEEWTQLTAAQRQTVLSQYHAAGIQIVVSLFGSTDAPTSTGADPVATANTMAAWVKQYDLDGVDVDYEDFNAMDAGNGKAEAWLTTFTQQLRTQLPQGQYILTHAPVAPWFTPGFTSSGAYLTVNKNVGSLIDWYNIQFYNQGSSEYTTCAGLLTTSGSPYPNSSVFQIAASGVPLSKLVIGKPAGTGDADSGYMSASALATCVSQAKSQGWNAGVSTWEWPRATASWISTVRGSAFPE